MRKLLMASAASLALTAGAAHAATFGPQPAEMDPTGYVSSWNAPKNNPDPGKVMVRVDGMVVVDMAIASANVDHGEAGTPNADAKNQVYGMSGYARLHFGIDGRTTNGLIYGANMEIRTNFPNQEANGQANDYLGQPSSNTLGTTLYIRRAFVYLGGDRWGIVRMGQGDGPVGIYAEHGVSTGEAFDLGGWDGDLEDFFGNATLAWPFADTGNEYASNKIAYLSPTLGPGFHVGASFAPSTANLSAASGSNAASGSFDRQSSSTLASDLGRARNTFEAAAWYTGPLFAGITTDDEVGGIVSGVVENATIGAPEKDHGVAIFDSGLVFNVPAGPGTASVFGHVYTGQMNGSVAPEPIIKGRHENGLAWVTGAMYSMGALTFGGSWYVFQHEGSAGGTGNRMERGLALGSDYTITKGLDAYLSFLYGTIHQSGVNFIDPAGPATAGNKTIARGVSLSFLVTW